jgi:hypothetical protein
MDATCFRASSFVRASVSTDGLVLLDVDGGLVLASNPIGARIWQFIEQRCTRVEIAQRLAADYDIPIERAHRDVGGFIDALRMRGLVREEPLC